MLRKRREVSHKAPPRQDVREGQKAMKSNIQNGLFPRKAAWHAAAGVGALLLTGGTGRAQTPPPPGIRVTINGQPVQFQDIGPQQIDGRTLVPVRGVLEKLGASIAFNAQTQTVVASTPNIDIQLKIGSKTAVVNGKEVTLDTPAQTIHDHTFVPLRFLGEALGADLAWDPATRTVRILTKDALNASVGQPARGPATRAPTGTPATETIGTIKIMAPHRSSIPSRRTRASGCGRAKDWKPPWTVRRAGRRRSAFPVWPKTCRCAKPRRGITWENGASRPTGRCS